MNYLPNSLPYELVATDGEFAFLPDTLKPKATIVASLGGEEIFRAEAPAHRLTGHRASFVYVPATVTDEAIALSYATLSDIPAYLFQAKLEFRIDGQPVPLVPTSFNSERSPGRSSRRASPWAERSTSTSRSGPGASPTVTWPARRS